MGMSEEDNGVCYETDRFIFCKFFSVFLVISLGWSFFFFNSTYLLPLSYDESLNSFYKDWRLGRQTVWNPV